MAIPRSPAARPSSTAEAAAYCTTVPHTSGMPSPCRFWYRVPAVPEASATRQAISPLTGTAPAGAGQAGPDDERHPGDAEHEPEPLPRRRPFPEHAARPARAVSTGCRLTITADTPAGIPAEMAKKVPPR